MTVSNVRTMPFDIDAEFALLGSILLEGNAIFDVDTEAHEFYLQKHQQIFGAMRQCMERGAALDVITVSSALANVNQLEQVGGLGYLTSLLNSVATASHARQYADAVRRAFIRRQIVDAATRIAEIGYDSKQIETADLVAAAMEKLRAIRTLERGEALHIGDAIADFLPRFEQYLDDQNRVWGITTGLDIDKYTGGLQSDHLWLVAGYPGKGKTSLALNLLERVCVVNTPAMFFSLEMSRDDLMQRLYASAGNVSSEKIRRGLISGEERDRILEGVNDLASAPLWIVDTPQTTDSIRAHVAKHNQTGAALKLVIVDYLRLLKDSGESETLRTNAITRAMKNLAREFHLTLILIHALNRSEAFNSAPTLRSLNYGGDYDADVVIFTHWDDKRVDQSASLLIAKNRHGRTGEIPMIYREELTRWDNPVMSNPFRMSQMAQVLGV